MPSGGSSHDPNPMNPTTCVRCGATLPAVAADQRHPEWCATCAARASGALPPPPSVAPPGPTGAGTWGGGPPAPQTGPLALGVVRAPAATRLAEGLLVGLAAAVVAGTLWWAVVAATERVFVYGAVLVGVIVGHGVLIGARRSGVGPAALAAGSTLVALAVAEYFVQRSITIADTGISLPLWQGFDLAVEVVRTSLGDNPIAALFWLVAAGAAAVTAGATGKRPLL